MYEDDDVSTFCVLYEDDDIKCVMERAPSFMDGAFIHTEVKGFSKNKFKKFKALWPEGVKYLRSQGINNLYALPPNEQAERWEKAFSFVDSGVTYEGQKIMVYKE